MTSQHYYSLSIQSVDRDWEAALKGQSEKTRLLVGPGRVALSLALYPYNAGNPRNPWPVELCEKAKNDEESNHVCKPQFAARAPHEFKIGFTGEFYNSMDMHATQKAEVVSPNTIELGEYDLKSGETKISFIGTVFMEYMEGNTRHDQQKTSLNLYYHLNVAEHPDMA